MSVQTLPVQRIKSSSLVVLVVVVTAGDDEDVELEVGSVEEELLDDDEELDVGSEDVEGLLELELLELEVLVATKRISRQRGLNSETDALQQGFVWLTQTHLLTLWWCLDTDLARVLGKKRRRGELSALGTIKLAVLATPIHPTYSWLYLEKGQR